MPEKVRRRRGPQYRTLAEVPQDTTEALRAFRDHVAGLSNRLPLSSVEAMRAGHVASPHTLTRRYLLAARRIGIAKDWAQRYASWVQRQVDCLWPMEPTPLAELRRRALLAEARANDAELAVLLTGTRDTLVADRDALQREIAADYLLIAKIERELEQTP